ncbi:MAG: class IV adenylate cyclase [Treponema sp.]|jgi:adenylate cyclase class 2|nr:class IV adenylate cyclase [Treponema sp.]
MIEIELKAWIDDPKRTKIAVSTLASFEREFEKEDSYWYLVEKETATPNFGVRIRKETDGEGTRSLVTYKIKEKRGRVEVNDEREFNVSDAKPFEALLDIFGLQVGARKRKKGWAWTRGGITAELCEVHGLGWFIELEILASSADEQTIREARGRLLSFLKEIGVGEDKIESRYYTEMLTEVKSGE